MKRLVLLMGLGLPLSVSAFDFKMPEIPEITLPKLPGSSGDEKEKVELKDSQETDVSRSPIEDLAEEDISKAKTIGSYTGTILGGALSLYVCKLEKFQFACQSGMNQALIAAGLAYLGKEVGEWAGEEIGTFAADRRREYATEQEYLDSEIKASEKAISVRQKKINTTNQQIEKSKKRIKELEGKAALTQSEIAEANKLKTELQEELAVSENTKFQYEEKIAYLDHVLESSKAEADEKKENIDKWQKKYDSLKQRKAKLEGQRDQIDSQIAQLEANEKALNKLIS